MKALGTLIGCSLLAIAGSAQAQSQPATGGTAPPSVENSQAQDTPSAATQTAPAEAGDIIVTAQRRSENLQNVPIAITVVGGEALKANNFTSITDVQSLAPSLKFNPSPQQASFSVRGVGSTAFDYSIEQSVGVSLDDVIQTLPRALALNTLADVERVEILRGPQGTLFGKNTSAGLISIVTRRPISGQYSAESHLQYGSRNELQAYSIVNLPIGDTLAARIRASYQLRDPVVRNLGPARLIKQKDYQFNGKLLWEPSSSFSLYAIGDYQNSSGEPGYFTVRSFGPATNTFFPGSPLSLRGTTQPLGLTPGPRNRDVALGGSNFQNSETYSGTLIASLDIGTHTLTSVTGYKHLDYTAQFEPDSTPQNVLDTNLGTIKADQLTQELRLASPSGGVVEYVVGAFYYKQNLDSTQLQAGGLGFLPNGFPVSLSAFGGRQNIGQSIENYAAFGEATIRPTESLRLILGARYTHDDIRSDVFISPVPGVCGLAFLATGGAVCQAETLPSPVSGGRTKRGDYTARGGVEFDLAPRVMAYATLSRGYKGGGFAVVSSTPREVQPETVVSGEVGLKSQFFDRRLTLNLAAFHSKFSDFQTQVFDVSVPPAGAFLTGNAGGLRTQGVELEFAARPVTGLNLSGGVSYIDAKFTDYQPACYAGQTAAQGCNLPGPTFDASGTRLPNSPKWSYTLSASYETAVSADLKAFANTNYSYRSSVIYGVGDPNTFQRGYGLLNLSVGVSDPEDQVRFSVFARNLLDKRFAGTIFPTFFDLGGYSQVLPDAAFRRIGVALDFRF